MIRSLRARPDSLAAAGVFLFLGLLYWNGRCRTFGAGDSPQHVISSLTFGVSRPPGYPLYNLLGFLFSKLPLGGPSAAVNGLSGILHAGAAAVFLLVLRRLGAGLAAGLCAAALMGLSPLYWYYSEVAEVRALNDLLALAAAYWALRWTQDREPRALAWLGAVLGLGLSHHPTFVMILPALAWWLWSQRALPSAGKAAWLLGLAVLFCALPYLILGMRLQASPPLYNPDEVRSWRNVLDLFLRRNVGGPLRMVSGTGVFGFGEPKWGRFAQHAGWFLGSCASELTFPGLLLAAGGAWSLRREGRRTLVFWLLWLGVSALVFIALSSQQMIFCDAPYARALVMRFHLLPLLALFALAGFGADWVLRRVRPGFGWLLLAGLVAFPLALRPLDLSRHDLLMDYAREILRSTRPSDMVILAGDDSILATAYLETIEHEGEDRVWLLPSLFSYPPYIRRLKREHPGLALPPFEPKGLTTDWKRWMKANPARRLFAEAVLKDAVLGFLPDSSPSGVLVRLSQKKPKRRETAAEARRFIDSARLEGVTRWDAHAFTQEIYVLTAYRAILSWYMTFLGPEDEETAGRILTRLLVL